MLKIKTWKDPYDMCFRTTKPTSIEINPGITVLVGCNGAGKTTLLRNIAEELKSQKIPHHSFNNLTDGGSNSIGQYLSGFGSKDNMDIGFALWSSSEGEAIKYNINLQSHKYSDFLNTGKYKKSDLEEAFVKLSGVPQNSIESNIRVFLFDATDSGMSVDAIIEIKALFEAVLQTSNELGLETYIIISANEYELCRNSDCFDVIEGEYLRFKDYEDYRKFILFTRKKKESRNNSAVIKREKRRLKNIERCRTLRTKLEAKADVIRQRALAENRELTRREEYSIADIFRPLNDLLHYYGLKIEDLDEEPI